MRTLFFIFFVIYSSVADAQLNCNNWFSTPSVPSFIDIGKLNVTGNQITVEAVINRTTPYAYGTGNGTEGDVISKHDNPTDVNYLLRPNHAYVTTTNGFFATPDISDINLNQTYHIAMVYDGDTLKFYRDGCLMSKVAATGNLYQNNWDTRIGYYQNQIWNTNFIGYINEVRIWDVARTQSQIQTYMNSSLPNPTTQPGLLAYYTFDNLINKQGNAAWNGTSGGSASINQTNLNCNAIVNTCPVPPPVCNIIITKNTDTTVCAASPVQMFATGGASYSWLPSTGLSDANLSNPVATPSTTTKYYVTVSDVNGCSKLDSVMVTINALPVISKSNDTTVCKNTQAQLVAAGGIAYSWSPGTTLSNTNISNPVAKPLTNTMYSVKVTNSDGCSETASINVNIKPVPAITISNDSLICNRSSVKIFVTGGISYGWSPAATLDNPAQASPMASPSATTKYHVQITDAQSCVYSDSVKISVRPPAVFSVSADEQICAKTNQQLIASGGDTYVWTPANFLDNPNANNPIASPGQTTTYSVTIKENTCNESTTLSTKLTVLPAPTVHAMTSNDITCTEPSTRLNALGAQNYSWTPTDGLNDANIANPVASPQHSTVYVVKGKDQNGCPDSDSISVKVDYDKNAFYGLPNSFTPNGDGLNDCFGVAHWGQISELDFSVYNRFGQRVFYTHNAADCWDGTFKGTPQDAAIFVYIVKAKTACGNIERKGSVTLLR